MEVGGITNQLTTNIIQLQRDMTESKREITIGLEEHSIEVHNSRRPLDLLTLILILTLIVDL